MRHTKLKVFLATIISVFNLAVCFTGTWAWFTALKTNNASQMQVQIYTHELDMSYRVYKYSDDEKSPINATGHADALKLPEYDSVIKSRNHDTALIIEFLMTGMDLGENIPVRIVTSCTDNSASSKKLSNIIELKFSTIPTITSNNAATIYWDAVDYFSNVNGICFKNGNSKTLEITYNLTNYASAIVDGSLRLYVQIDYSEALIDDFTFDITDASTTSFDNDLTMINCYTD